MYTYDRCMPIVVQEKPTQHYKAIIPQLNFFFLVPRYRLSCVEIKVPIQTMILSLRNNPYHPNKSHLLGAGKVFFVINSIWIL